MRLLLTFTACLIWSLAHAQQDTITLTNNDVLVGEIKGLNQGVLTMETDYSDADFKIEWEGVKTIHSETFFLITLSDGRRFNGKLTTTSEGHVAIHTETNGSFSFLPKEIVFMESVDKGFWSRAHASIDFGWDVTKANNLRQASLRSNIGYLAERWSTNAYYNALTSNQDSVKKVSRNDAGIDFKYYFQKKWFAVASTTFLANTEQKLILRTNGGLGLGTYILQTNTIHWNVSGGASFNKEQYELSSEDRQSWEGYVGTDLNMFNTGDLSLRAKIAAYPSLTESGRWRTDFDFDIKYDLPKDFYIKLGIALNYDNRPIEGASESDYVFATGFGWEL
ncbi:DUF481 domain-containing protein [Carboxylicivirga taeanensis]|uniref:DUF481 domain-containing protein n=1 Tax=Carboxylicivirga taeanensis TaxID=1416875 RepID=UPI003F6E2AC6